MKPGTIEMFTRLACTEAKKSVDEFEYLDAATLDVSELRTYAQTCGGIITIFEALENLLLTAADEEDRLNSSVEEYVDEQ